MLTNKNESNRLNRVVLVLSSYLFLSGFLFSQNSGAEKLEMALNDLCCDLQAIVPVTAMLLVIAAGVIYSIGQIFGAETRARANVWATSCLTGAVIGILIAQIAPHILGIIAGTTVACSC